VDITFVQSFNFQIIRQEFFHIDTTSMPLKVLVLGHSFVRRLETDIINQVHPVLILYISQMIININCPSKVVSRHHVLSYVNLTLNVRHIMILYKEGTYLKPVL
jgi:hypothetical protein